MGASCLPAFLDETPDYEVRDGRMYITMRDFCLAMPLDIYLKGAARGEAAVAKWQIAELGNDGRRVVQLRQRK